MVSDAPAIAQPSDGAGIERSISGSSSASSVECQQLAIPPGIFRELIVGNNIRADLGGGKMINADGRDVAHADQLRRFDPAVSGNDSVGAIDQNRIDKPKFLDAGLDLPNLLCGMCSGIASARFQLRGVFIRDL